MPPLARAALKWSAWAPGRPSAGSRVGLVIDGISKYLESDADVATSRRKLLRPDPVGPWELRLGDYRVFYEVTPAGVVRVLAIGHKAHNDLFMRGRRIEI